MSKNSRKLADFVREVCAEAIRKGKATAVHGIHYTSMANLRNTVAREGIKNPHILFKVHDKYGRAEIHAYLQSGNGLAIEEQIKDMKDAIANNDVPKFERAVTSLRMLGFPPNNSPDDDDSLV